MRVLVMGTGSIGLLNYEVFDGRIVEPVFRHKQGLT